MISKLKAINFFSWAELEFDFRPGITFLEGWNFDDQTPEGSGKTSCLNALCWGLFGALPRDLKTDDVIREGAKSCSVEILLENGTKIIRTRKPNDLWIQDPDSTEKLKGRDAKETQTLIENLIGLSFETFCQAIYFAQNYPNKFVTANEADKAKILSEIQDLSVFDKARKEATTRAKALELEEFSHKKELAHLIHTIEALESKIDDFKKLKAEADRGKTEAIEAILRDLAGIEKEVQITRQHLTKVDEGALFAKIAELEADSKRLLEERAKLKTQLAGQEDVKRLKQRMESQIFKLTQELAAAESQPKIEESRLLEQKRRLEKARDESKEARKILKTAQKALENPEKANCPTCNQPWDGNLSHYEKEVQKAEQAAKRADLDVQFCEKDLASIQKSHDAARERLPRVKTELELAKKDLSSFVVPDSRQLEDSIAELSEALEGLEELKATINSQLHAYARDVQTLNVQEKRIQDLKAQLVRQEAKTTAQLQEKLDAASREMSQHLAQLEALEKALSKVQDDLIRLEELKQGFKDVKSFVFQGLLSELNRKTNRYLSELFEQPVKIKFDNQTENGDVSKIEVEVTIDGQARALGLYSGGQFRRISFAVDLALSDIVADRGDKPFQLLILDEQLKDLSEISMEKILRLLERRKGSVLMIEHNSVFKTLATQVFKVELRDGISRRVDAN